MEDFTLGLALYDFLPVILTGVAVLFIARVIKGSGVPAAGFAGVGALLVLAAGTSKAIWKLIATLTHQDLAWMATLLFPLMAPGFALLAAGVWAAQRKSAPSSGLFWAAPFVAITVAFSFAAYRITLGVERGWFMPIMALASLSNMVLTVLLFRMAWKQGRRTIAVLFTVNLAMVFALIPIAQMDNHSIAMHWLEQTLTACGAAAFAFAAFRLYRGMLEAKERVAASAAEIFSIQPGLSPKMTTLSKAIA